uniref:Immunoglobulin domain-containing protein n=1 Tax=Pygocentrus nattereri TaxID=42514 RepID=A0AAR2KI40_PYGNA
MDMCPLLVGGGESERVMGYSGGGVLIKCSYERRYTSNPKYLCKGPWSNCGDQIKTGNKNEWINSGRFSLFDDTRAAQFWVVIRELTVEDSGTYQCAVDISWQKDVYTPVQLNVEEDLSYKKNISVTGHVGGSVNISCKYPQSHSSDPKFLCRRVGTADCSYETSVKESRRWRNEGKLYLHDDGKQVFTVVINRLTEGDSGEYWCGAESDWTSDHGYKVFITQINLRVTEPTTPPSSSTSRSRSTPQSTKRASSTASTTTMRSSFKSSTAADILPQKGSQTTKTTVSSTFEPTLSQFSAIAFPVSSVVTGVPVILLLLLIGLLFFIVTLRKRNKTRGPASIQSQSHRGSSDNHTVSRDVCVYEEVKDIPVSDAGASTVYSTAELPTNPSEPSQTLYDNVQLSTNPSEPSQTVPTYTTVNFSKNADSSTDAVPTATINKENDSCDYATVEC